MLLSRLLLRLTTFSPAQWLLLLSGAAVFWLLTIWVARWYRRRYLDTL